MYSEFHFLRPLWLLCLFVLFLLPLIPQEISNKKNAWYKIADYSLLKKLLFDSEKKKQSSFFKWMLAIFWIIAVLGLSGPTWQKKEVKGIITKTNYILVAEISPYLLAADLKPSRIERLKYKLYDVLDELQNNNVAMILYDNYPYLLTPFTNDTNIIKNFVKVFDVSMMPNSGSDLNNALTKAIEVAKNYPKTNIILFYGGGEINEADVLNKAEQLKNKGHKLFIIGVGSSESIPIQDNQGNFIKNSQGTTAVSKMDYDILQKIAKSGGGAFYEITSDDKDINSILQITSDKNNKSDSTQTIQVWQDMGVYVPLILLPFIFILFRNSFFVICFLLISFPAYSFEWDDLWLNGNQQGLLFFDKNPEKAAEKFQDKSYKGSSYYKSKQYDKALQNFIEKDELYNAGNALANLGKIEEAIEMYENVLNENPDHEDAKFNLEYLKKQQNQNNNEQQDKQEENNKNQNQDEKSSQNNKQNQSGSGQKSQSQSQGKSDKKEKQSSANAQWEIDEEQKEQGKQKQLGSKNQKEWLEKIENNPYDLLKAKLQLIYEKEYYNK